LYGRILYPDRDSSGHTAPPSLPLTPFCDWR